MSNMQVITRISPTNTWTHEAFSHLSKPDQFGQPHKIEVNYFTDPKTGIQYKMETTFIFDPYLKDHQCTQIPGFLSVNTPVNFPCGNHNFYNINVPKIIEKDDLFPSSETTNNPTDKPEKKKYKKKKKNSDELDQDIEYSKIPKERKKKTKTPLSSLSTYFRENECLICGFIALYESKENAKEHMKTHLVDDSFVCDCCDEVYATASLLYRHKIRKTKKKPYVCEICQKKFKRNSFLSSHFRVQHAPFVQPPETDKPSRPKYFMRPHFECCICQTNFHNMHAVSEHRTSHGDADKFKCINCDKLFFKNDDLMQHRHVHGPENNYTCATCKKQFSSQRSLKEHRKLHKRKQLFSCVVCNEKFYLQCKLLEHQRLKHTVS